MTIGKGWTILGVLLLALALYLHFFKLDQYKGQAEQRREYKRMHNK